MTHDWTKTITIKKWIWLKISKKYTKGYQMVIKKIINGYVYVETIS